MSFSVQPLKDDREIVLAAIKSSSRAILYASTELQDDTEVGKQFEIGQEKEAADDGESKQEAKNMLTL